MQPLVLLVTPGYIQSCNITGALFFLEQKCSISSAEQAIRAGNHVELILRLLLSRVMHQQETDMVFICELFQLANDFIIIRVAEFIAASLTDFLQSIDDNELGIGMLVHEPLKLFIQPAAELLYGSDTSRASATLVTRMNIFSAKFAPPSGF